MNYIKNNIKKLTFVFVVLSFVLLNIFYLTSNVNAQESLDIITFPAKQEVVISPGETKTVAIVFYNKTLYSVTGNLGTADFIVRGNNNVPEFIDRSQINTRYSAATWIKVPYEQASLPANDQLIVYVNVTVPADALPGGHYSSVYFETNPAMAANSPVGKQGVSVITHRINALLYFNVPGDIKETARVYTLKADKFREYGPINVETEIQNGGYLHIQPKGKIIVKNMLGKVVEEVNLEEKNIFPEAISGFKNTVGQKWMFGQYQILVDATYGASNKPLNASLTVLVFPWRVTLAILLALIIIGLLMKNYLRKTIIKEAALEKEVEREKSEIEKLKEELKKRE